LLASHLEIVTRRWKRAELLATKSGSRYVPERGDVVWLTFDPQSGHEQAGRRPAVVLSPRLYNRKAGHALFAPITNQVKGYPFEVMIPSGLPVTGAVLADQMKSLDWRARNALRICSLSPETIRQVLQKAAVLVSTAG
jgi:mRNA interferase MazF